MSQFDFTPEEGALVVDCLRARAQQQEGFLGAVSPALAALIAKVEGQPAAVQAVSVEEPEVVVETTEGADEVPKSKRARAE